MSTQKSKFQLFSRLQELGFTYEESQQLRRIQLTLRRWAERECGDGSNFAIERDEQTGKPFSVYHGPNAGWNKRYPIADREAGALRRLKAIVDARNFRSVPALVSGNKMNPDPKDPRFIFAYHQTDPRGCALYLVTRSQLISTEGDHGAHLLPIESNYNRGLAVCC